MTPTHADYENALTRFVQEIGRLAENGLSVLLYGSMARGDIIPGHSDLDFWVFLKKEALQNPERFRQAYDVMVQAAESLAASGLPVFHAFCYYGEAELHLLPQALVPNLQTGRSSRVVWGEDVRIKMRSTSASRYFYQTSYFLEMREQMFLPMTRFVGQPLSEKVCERIVAGLKYVKYVPEAACAALNLWPGELDAVARLAAEMPEIDISIVSQIEAFRTGFAPTSDPTKVQEMLQLALTFVERVNEALWQRSGQ